MQTIQLTGLAIVLASILALYLLRDKPTGSLQCCECATRFNPRLWENPAERLLCDDCEEELINEMTR